MNKKRWSIAVMAILALTACGKNETNQVSTADKNEVSPDSYSADDSSSEPETKHTVSRVNQYFMTDSFYAPVEITYPAFTIKCEYNDKGWLTKYTEKDPEHNYERICELSYKEDGGVVIATVADTEQDPEMGSTSDESSYYIFNDDWTKDIYRIGDYITFTIPKRDDQGRAVSIEYIDETPANPNGDRFAIKYSDEGMYVEQKDFSDNTIRTTYYQNYHIPQLAAYAGCLDLAADTNDVMIDENGLITDNYRTSAKCSYDKDHRIVSLKRTDADYIKQHGENVSTFTYDISGKLISQTINYDDIEDEYKHEFIYDENGNLSEMHTQVGDNATETVSIKYEKVPASIAALCSLWLVSGADLDYYTDSNWTSCIPFTYFCREI